MTSALIVGCSKGAEAEMASALSLFEPDHIIAINDAGCWIDHPSLDAWCSYHIEKIESYRAARVAAGLGEGPTFYTSISRPVPPKLDLSQIKRVRNLGGTSALLGVQVARDMGCDKIALAGVPLDAEAGRMGREGSWEAGFISLYRAPWLKDETLKNMVRSMSGWTKAHFGPVTKVWAKGWQKEDAHGESVRSDGAEPVSGVPGETVEPEPEEAEQHGDNGQG